MATTSSKLKVAELDFDTIKSNLKNFMGDQNEFADFDFDASALSVLLDLLAYNTHYNAFYLNMVVNEMFLDTASIRNSVVSRAKHLGYTPQSVRGAKAYVDLTITPNDTPATIVIEKDTQFSSSVNGISYLFATSNSVTLNVNSNGVYTTANVELNQGIPLTHKYTANTKIQTKNLYYQTQIQIQVLSRFRFKPLQKIQQHLLMQLRMIQQLLMLLLMYIFLKRLRTENMNVYLEMML